MFEVDFHSGELRKSGVRIPLQEQPRRILELLIERRSELVTREELRQALWPTDTFVDFEHGLNAAIKRLRDGLGDAADSPRFVETLPRRGYRFIAPIVDETNASPTASATPGPSVSVNRTVVLMLMIAIGSIVAIAMLARRGRVEPGGEVAQFDLSLGPSLRLERGSGGGGFFALSPNGGRVVVAARRRDGRGPQQLFQRRLDQLDFTAIAGTENSTNPFFSPDGEWVGFYSGGQIKKVALAGGMPVTICDVSGFHAWGAAWGDDGTLVFAADRRLYRVSAGGGTAEALVPQVPENENYFWPTFLPGSSAVLYAAGRADSRSGIRFYIGALDLRTKAPRTIIDKATYPRFVAGFIVYAQQSSKDANDPFSGGLLAVPFDPVRLRVTGPPLAAADHVHVGGGGGAHYELSGEGTLVFVSAAMEIGATVLQWLTPGGSAQPLASGGLPMLFPRLSPDDHLAAVQVDSGIKAGVHVYDFGRGTLSRLPLEGGSGRPVFTPDGRTITFSSTKDAKNAIASNLWNAPVDASGAAERLLTSDYVQVAGGWSPNGETLVFHEFQIIPSGQPDILSLPRGAKRPQRFLASSFDERDPAFSTDGRWIAYVSNASGRPEVYVQPFPGPGARYAISTDGGEAPVWAKHGPTLFYVHGEDELMSVDVSAAPSFHAGRPRLVLRSADLMAGLVPASPRASDRNYDVAANGRVLVTHRESEGRPVPLDRLRVVLNFSRELARRAAAPKTGTP